MEKLIKKYDTPGPRYTSFPALPFWQNNLSSHLWMEHIQGDAETSGIDLYIHIPYCQKLCWYCGCNRIITKNKDKAKEYIKALKNEWNYYLSYLPNIKINSIHFGGGTPTFLPAKDLEDLLGKFKPSFAEKFLGSIEIDPRTVDRKQLEVLKRFGFQRASLGIQDFDETVQKQINRIQPYSLVEDVVNLLREYDFNSINFDLIFGLPGQTISSIQDTVNKVSSLNPDLLAFYSYAHLPERIPNQKLIKSDLLPTGREKRELYEEGKKALFQAGFFEVGMDHFAKEHSYLYQAYKNKNLFRSFMGYTDTKSDTLIGLGATSISNSPMSFRQNEKDVGKYIEQMHAVTLPRAETSHSMTSSDQIIFQVIQEIMCNDQTDLTDLATLGEWPHILKGLEEFEVDGLVELEQFNLKITEIGKIFIRNICMIFDPYLGQKGALRFSRTI